MKKFYEVQRGLNNLYWQTEAFFERKADSTKYIKKRKKYLESRGIDNPRLRVEEREFSKLKDFARYNV